LEPTVVQLALSNVDWFAEQIVRSLASHAVLQPCVDAATLAKDSRANTDSKAGNFDRTRSAHQADVHCALPQNTESARLVCSLRA